MPNPLIRAKSLFGLIRLPKIGEAVWWAPKGVGCVITDVLSNGNVVFQGGPVVRNKRGRQVPQWTVATGGETPQWDESIQMWIVGQGPLPKNTRGTIITPDPVALSGKSVGSFAVRS